MKRRIDQLLVERGFAESRHKAQALLIGGQVLVNGQKIEKPGQQVDPWAGLRILKSDPFVSRAGSKLQAALDHFALPVADRVCADLGASTGGFTDCLLQHGAREVHAFDVGKAQLDWKLRSDPRVIVRDEFNVRHLTADDLPPALSLITVDLSFISLTKILLPLREALVGRTKDRPIDLILLVKPQFEVGKGEVGKGGIVRDDERRARAVASVVDFARSAGFQVIGQLESPVRGSKGNVEFLLYLQLHPDLSSRA
jgi:23S rRNA (cytidine1920-2'-O)/16S rRNA (cytidine1409-2'-O)-methyltransferase